MARIVITEVADGQIKALLLGKCSLIPGDEIIFGDDDVPDLDNPDIWYGKLGASWTGPRRGIAPKKQRHAA